MMGSFVLTVVLFWLALFHALPAFLVISSRRVGGNDLTMWLLAVLFTSWLGFVAFLVVTTMDAPRKRAADAVIAQRRRHLPVTDISDRRPG